MKENHNHGGRLKKKAKEREKTLSCVLHMRPSAVSLPNKQKGSSRTAAPFNCGRNKELYLFVKGQKGGEREGEERRGAAPYIGQATCSDPAPSRQPTFI